jgi:transcriptional regulator with XRE-family HTH domain
MSATSIPTREPHPIRAYRERRGISMRTLAAEVSISVPALSRIEAGEVELPNIGIIARLARATGGEVSEIDIFRYHFAAAIGCVAPMRAPMTSNFSWAWVRVRSGDSVSARA